MNKTGDGWLMTGECLVIFENVQDYRHLRSWMLGRFPSGFWKRGLVVLQVAGMPYIVGVRFVVDSGPSIVAFNEERMMSMPPE